MSLYKTKAKFTASALTYNATAAANTLKYDGISTAAQVNQNANLAINGDLATKAGSGFSTPHRIALTSASNDAGSSVQFKVTGTSDGSTSLVETVNAGNASTVFTNGAFKTVTEIKVLGANTQGVVSVGIASVLEEAAYSAAQAITYTITADDIPVGIDPLVVNLTSPGVTAVFDYGTKNQATSREFLVDDDKISVSANQPNGALTLVGSATASFSSPHNITVTSGGNDSSKYFWIVGTDANNDPQTVKLQGSSGSTATTTETFKTVSSITVKDGNGGSANNVAAAGTVKAGVTDEDIAVTVTAFAAQDSTKESNPHNVTVSHAIFQNDKAATAYSKEIADISIPIQDRNLPVGADSTIQTAKSTKYTFKASDFGYSDPDGVALKKIKIMTAEAKGDLEINGADIVVSGGSANNEIALADISKLTFMPTGTEGGSGYGNFTFKVSDGLDWSTSANTMNVNVGDSVQTTINYYAQNTSGTAANQAIKSATIVMKDSGGNAAYTGVYATNTSGVADFTGVSGGDYTLSFAVTDTVGDTAINMSDVSKALAIATLNATPTTDQKVAMDINGDGKTNMSDVSAILGMAVNLRDTGAGALRNTAVSDQYATKIVAISAGTNLTLDAYLLGDLDGSYANILAAG